MDLGEIGWVGGVGSVGPGQGPVAGCWEHGDVPSGSDAAELVIMSTAGFTNTVIPLRKSVQ
jgi:hypothetical protein